MEYDTTKEFDKRFKQLNKNRQKIVIDSIVLFIEDSSHPKLRVHALKHKLKGLYAFSAGGDLRIIFKYQNDKLVLLTTLGTHNQVYK